MIRRVKVLSGSPRMRVLMRPRFDWGRTPPVVTQGSTHLRYVGPSHTLRLNSDAPLSYLLSETFFVVDRPMNFILGPDETLTSAASRTRPATSSRRPPATGAPGPARWRCRWSGRTR